MDWIKVEAPTPRKPEVLKLARILGVSVDDAFGKAMRFWLWLDGICVDGRVDGVASQDVDAALSCDGLVTAMCAVGWCAHDDQTETLTVPNWDRHNGESAKGRALKAKRQKKWRVKNVDGQASTCVDAMASTREEKIRKDKNNKNPPNPPKGNRKSVNGVRVYSADFETFWSSYPPLRRKSKPTAWDAWERAITRTSVATILAAARDFAASDQGRGKFCPGPAAWLNQDRWDDDRAAWKLAPELEEGVLF